MVDVAAPMPGDSLGCLLQRPGRPAVGALGDGDVHAVDHDQRGVPGRDRLRAERRIAHGRGEDVVGRRAGRRPMRWSRCCSSTANVPLPHVHLPAGTRVIREVRGQVEQFVVDAWTGSAWQHLASGTTIGHAGILVLGAPVTTDRLRVQVLDARSTPRLSFVGAYLTVAPS